MPFVLGNAGGDCVIHHIDSWFPRAKVLEPPDVCLSYAGYDQLHLPSLVSNWNWVRSDTLVSNEIGRATEDPDHSEDEKD